jgi:hypothetical protein
MSNEPSFMMYPHVRITKMFNFKSHSHTVNAIPNLKCK